MPARGDGRMFAIDPALDETVDRVDEIVAIELRMKTEHGAAEQSLDDRALPGTDAEGFRVGPRNVPERDDGGLRQPLANHLRQQREMIILHEYQRVRALDLLQHRLGEALIDGTILVPVRLPECRAHEHDVTQWPHPFVGKAVVIADLL